MEIRSQYDSNEIWFENARRETASDIAEFDLQFKQTYRLILAKRAERAKKATTFVYPQIRKPDNHRRRYRSARRETFLREKKGIQANWMLA